MSHQFCPWTWADNDFVGHLATNRMYGDRPLMSHDPSADAVSHALIFHRIRLDLNRDKRNALLRENPTFAADTFTFNTVATLPRSMRRGS